MRLSFRGGIHIAGHKETGKLPIEVMPAPGIVRISLAQHSGPPLKATVAPGDKICLGQIIGMSDWKFACPVHSSVSGRVSAIEKYYDPVKAAWAEAVIIENDGLDTPDESILRAQAQKREIERLTTDEVISILKYAGVVGLGGAVFPAHIKIQNSLGKAKTLLINCAECEPYITVDHRAMLEYPEKLLGGVDIIIRAMGIERTMIAVEDNKADAAAVLAGMTEGRADIEVKLLKTKYPQGDKGMIIYALSKTKVARSMRLADLGYIIFNASTCVAIYNACAEGMPLTQRVVTVTGDCIKNPKNVLARIGTPVADLIGFCGGLVKAPEKIINGGPMMGNALWDTNYGLTKGMSALLALSGRDIKDELPACCINCGRCVQHCPMRLMPNYLARLGKAQNYDRCYEYNVNDCLECGVCSYVCPGRVEIVQYIRQAKNALYAAGKR